MAGLAEGAAVAWPLLVAVVCAVVIDRRREDRRRAVLNRALHELRRPLQYLALAWPPPFAPGSGTAARRQLAAALAALDDLEAQINGLRSPRRRSVLRADELVSEAVERWRSPAASQARDLELHWRAGKAAVLGDRTVLSRALDNLIANSLEHGGGRIRIEATVGAGRLRIAVIDAWAPEEPAAVTRVPFGPRPAPPGAGAPRAGAAGGRNPYRGHGLATVARAASDHGGWFAFDRQGRGAQAVIELPLAAGPPPALRHEARSDAA